MLRYYQLELNWAPANKGAFTYYNITFDLRIIQHLATQNCGSLWTQIPASVSTVKLWPLSMTGRDNPWLVTTRTIPG